MKVFLSHSSRDKSLVREIRRNLPEHVKTWLDENDIIIGQDIEVSIQNAIQKEADFVIIFIGKEAIQSDWVKRELQWALEREKEIDRVFVLPILLDDVWDQVEPTRFQKRLYLKCFDQSESEVRNLSDKLSSHIFKWLCRHLDESKKKELQRQREADSQRDFVKTMADMGLGTSLRPDALGGWERNVLNELKKLASDPLQLALERLEFLLKDWKRDCLEGIDNCSTDDFWSVVKKKKEEGKDTNGLGDAIGAFLDLEMTGSQTNYKKKLRRIERVLNEIRLHKKHTVWKDSSMMLSKVTLIMLGE